MPLVHHRNSAVNGKKRKYGNKYAIATLFNELFKCHYDGLGAVTAVTGTHLDIGEFTSEE
jgi:hypothetical protein